jgi:hypothetical protein
VRKHGAERQCATLLQLALSATEATGPGRSDENQWRVGDRQRILLVDLLPGHAAPAVCAAVLRALLRKTAVVLGYGLRNDLQRILPPLLSALGAGGPSVNAQDNAEQQQEEEEEEVELRDANGVEGSAAEGGLGVESVLRALQSLQQAEEEEEEGSTKAPSIPGATAGAAATAAAAAVRAAPYVVGVAAHGHGEEAAQAVTAVAATGEVAPAVLPPRVVCNTLILQYASGRSSSGVSNVPGAGDGAGQTAAGQQQEHVARVVACVLRAGRRLDRKALAHALGLHRPDGQPDTRALRFVPPSALVALCGHARGVIGPIGLRDDANTQVRCL